MRTATTIFERHGAATNCDEDQPPLGERHWPSLPTTPAPLGDYGRLILPLPSLAVTDLTASAERYRIEKPPPWL
jgi:hypothetical protein